MNFITIKSDESNFFSDNILNWKISFSYLIPLVLIISTVLFLSCNHLESQEKIRISIEPQFNFAVFSEGLILASSDSSYGYFNILGKITIDLSAKHISYAWPFHEGLAKFKKDNKYGFIDKQDNIIIPAKFNAAWDFSEGLAAVRLEDKWGLINKSGQFVITPTFTNAESFSDGYALINIGGNIDGYLCSQSGEPYSYIVSGGKKCYIDRTGKIMIELKTDWAFQFVNGFAAVNVGGELDNRGNIRKGKWGYLNKAGEIIPSCLCDAIKDFEEGFAVVKSGDLWGFIDETGKFVVEPKFSEAYSFSEGLACVLQLNDGYRYIDSSGNFVISQSFASAGDFVEGLAPSSVDGMKFGYINKKGEWVIKPQFDSVEHFSEGYAIIHFNTGGVGVKLERFGHIDKKQRSSGGFSVPTKVSFINKNGKRIINQTFDDATPFEDGLAAINVDGKWGYLIIAH